MKMAKLKYKYLEHTADAKFQAFGDSLGEAFENSAFAMLNLMCKTKAIKPEKKIKVIARGRDLKALLYNWLEEILFLLSSKSFLTGKINNLKISGREGNYKLDAVLLGGNAENYETFGEVKAVTYNSMFIKQERGKEKRFIIQAVVDM